MRVVFILLDAFKQEYISEMNTPFLYSKSGEGKHIKKLIPSAGFCERTEIFFGLKPKQSGFFTAIGFNPNNGAYKASFFLNLFGWIEQKLSLLFYFLWKNKKNSFDTFFQKILQKIYFKFFGSFEKMKPYKIPLNFLKYFNLTEDEFELNELKEINGNKSLFEIVKELKKETYLGAFTSLGSVSNGTDVDRINLAVEASKNEKNLFIPIYINTADFNGHHFGPNSKKLKEKVKELDSILENCMESFLANDPATKFIFLGDHGMTEVKKVVDVKMELLDISKKFNLKLEKDYIFFLDSTLLRLWFFNDKTRNIFNEEFKKNSFFVNNGIVIDHNLANKYDIPIDDRRYGDIAWWANEEVLIFPDFFHNDKAVKGMHGYEPNKKSTYGTCFFWDKNSRNEEIEELELHQIYNFIKKALITV